MFKYTQILILIFCIFSKSLKNEKTTKKKQRNFLKNFKPDQVNELVKKFKYVMIGFIDKKTHKGQEIKKSFKLVSKEHIEEKDFFWTWIDIKKMSKEQKQQLDVYSKNEIHLYYQQHRKKYHGQTTAEKLYNWFLEIKGASVSHKISHKKIHKVDTHYFVYCSESFYEYNKDKLEVLAKLIYPIQIIKGFNDQNFEKKFKRVQTKEEFFIYREYKRQQVKIQNLDNLLELSDYIEQNEFPNVMKPNKQSLKLMLEYKIPTVIYFTKNRKDKNIKLIQELANQHKEYFLYMFVACSKKCDKYQKFLINFLQVKKRPSLRILQVKKTVNRYKLIGKLDKDIIEYFFSNYLNSHLKSYQINESLDKKRYKYGIEKLNTKSVKNVLQKFDKFTLIYVYSNLKSLSKIKNDLEILKQIQEAYSINDYFQVYTLNNDRNDFQGKRSTHLPTLILKPRSNQLKAYSGKFDFESIEKFLLENNRHLIKKLSSEL